MKRQLSEAAQAAKLIRVELKKHGIKARVTSKCYSMGSHVRVSLTDQPYWIVEAIKSATYKYVYGHFDGMQDLYEISNRNDNIPQTKYLFIDNEYSVELLQDAWSKMKGLYQQFDDYPMSYVDAKEHDWKQRNCHTIGDMMHRYLNGYESYAGSQFSYFQKPRVAA